MLKGHVIRLTWRLIRFGSKPPCFEPSSSSTPSVLPPLPALQPTGPLGMSRVSRDSKAAP